MPSMPRMYINIFRISRSPFSKNLVPREAMAPDRNNSAFSQRSLNNFYTYLKKNFVSRNKAQILALAVAKRPIDTSVAIVKNFSRLPFSIPSFMIAFIAAAMPQIFRTLITMAAKLTRYLGAMPGVKRR